MTDPATLPAYIDRLGHGEICFPQPLRLLDTVAFAFGLPATRSAMQGLVDGQLNAACAPALRYEVLSDTVLLTFLEVASATSLAQTIGVQGDREAAIWIPLLEWRHGHLFPRLVFWVPYLLINVDTGMVVGREIWGYRKSLGAISIPEDGAAPARFAASTTIFAQFGPTERAENAELIAVARTGTHGPLADEFHDIEGFAAAMAEALARHGGFAHAALEDGTFALDVARMLMDRIVPVVNLKQFRATEDAFRACYQAMTESPCHLDAVHGGGLMPGDWTCSILRCASHRIPADLGLTGTDTGTHIEVPVNFAFRVRFDFTTRNGITLWQAGG